MKILQVAGVVGLEPTKWRDQNPLPYHLATPQNLCPNTLTKFKKSQHKRNIIVQTAN